jgi:hypothetical protein
LISSAFLNCISTCSSCSTGHSAYAIAFQRSFARGLTGSVSCVLHRARSSASSPRVYMHSSLEPCPCVPYARAPAAPRPFLDSRKTSTTRSSQRRTVCKSYSMTHSNVRAGVSFSQGSTVVCSCGRWHRLKVSSTQLTCDRGRGRHHAVVHWRRRN